MGHKVVDAESDGDEYVSVSYTHLDVYKRQLLDIEPFRDSSKFYLNPKMFPEFASPVTHKGPKGCP